MVKAKWLIIVLIIVVAAVPVAYWIGRQQESRPTDQKLEKKLSDSGSVNLLNPESLYDKQKHFIVNFQPLRHSFEEIQKKYPQKTYIYFVYLNNSSWVGINEREPFVAASTIKVPLAIAVSQAIEKGLLTLDSEYTLEHLNLDDNFGDLYKNEGQSYTVRQLLEYMLSKSDNTAANALTTALTRLGVVEPLFDVYQYMGWEGFELGQAASFNKISVKLLSNMFLALYNASYISPEHSQLILQDLTQSQFNDQIRAGVPEDIQIAHKMGISTNNETFADCGIVYAPNRPYILCLASNGGDEKVADGFMKEVSETVYKYVINN
jgi:beta-lactamase class A